MTVAETIEKWHILFKDLAEFFNPDQPRDNTGKWTTGGWVSGGSVTPTKVGKQWMRREGGKWKVIGRGGKERAATEEEIKAGRAHVGEPEAQRSITPIKEVTERKQGELPGLEPKAEEKETSAKEDEEAAKKAKEDHIAEVKKDWGTSAAKEEADEEQKTDEKENKTGTTGTEHPGSEHPGTDSDEGRLAAYQKALSAQGGQPSTEIDKLYPSTYSAQPGWQRTKIAADRAVMEKIRGEGETLYNLAKERGELLPEMEDLPDKEGSEHRVWFTNGGDTIVKETYSGPKGLRFGIAPLPDAVHMPEGSGYRYQTATEYLNRIALNNQVFNDPHISVLGISTDKRSGDPVIRTTYPTIHSNGSHPQWEEIHEYMTNHGFRELTDGYGENGAHQWQHGATGIIASDARPLNFIKDDNGDLHPVDVMLQQPAAHAAALSSPFLGAASMETLEQVLQAIVDDFRAFYSPDQARDYHGRWTAEGAGFKPATPEEFIEARNKSARAGYMSPLKPEGLQQISTP